MLDRSGRTGTQRVTPWRSQPARHGGRATIVAASVACLVLGCDRHKPRTQDAGATVAAPSARGFNVLLISLDTTRADHLGCYGHPARATPNFDRLAAEGALFEQCTTTAPLTLPAHASLLSGLYPFAHGARDNATFRVPPEVTLISESLKQAGYRTAAHLGAFVLNREYGLDQGFDEYQDVRGPAGGGVEAERLAEDVGNGAIRWLRASPAAPFLLFVHFFDPHQPYHPPPQFASRLSDPYLGEIAYADEQVGRLLATLEELRLAQRTLVVLTADHGEARGEHHEDTHGMFLYDATLSVPLIFRCPAVISPGRRVAAQVRLIDVTPTILALLERPPLPDAQGVSLLPLLRGEQRDLGLRAYAETFSPKFNLGFAQLRALRAGGWKYIHAPRPELYHVAEDPHETGNLAAVESPRAQEMASRLRELLETAPRVAPTDTAQRPTTTEDARRLAALGYLGGASVQEDERGDELDRFEPRGPNPMDRAEEIRLTTEASNLLVMGRLDDAERILRGITADAAGGGGNAWAFANLAGVLAQRGQYEEAVGWFEKALQFNPRDSLTRTRLGLALLMAGHADRALAELRTAATREPVSPFTRQHLALALAAQGALDEAVTEYERAAQANPGLRAAFERLVADYQTPSPVASQAAAPDRNGRPLELAALAREANLPAAARNLLADLTQRDPQHALAYALLGETLRRLGQADAAIANLRRAVALDPSMSHAWDVLAYALIEQRQHAAAIDVLRGGLQHNPQHASMANNLAWLLATAPQAALRNGAEALRWARVARDAAGRRDANVLATLAAAQAEAGDFDEAVRAQRRAIELARRDGPADFVTRLEARLRLYESRQPFHEAP